MISLKKNSTRTIAGVTLGVITLSSIPVLTTPAEAAGSRTWKKAAIAGAAVTAYGHLRRKKGVRNLGAAATAGSYLMYRRARKKEKRRRY